MDPKLYFIPAAVMITGVTILIIVCVILKKKAKVSDGVAQKAMKEFVNTQISASQSVNMKVINLQDESIRAQYIWIAAYNKEGIFLIPVIPNPFTQSFKRYEDLTPEFNWRKQLAAHILSGNKAEEIDYIPRSAITQAVIDSTTKKVTLVVGNIQKTFKYDKKDCFGVAQEEVVEDFLSYLKEIGI